MMMLTHAAISGGLGEIVGNPFIAFSLGILIHLLLDKLPHRYISVIFDKKSIFRYIDTILTIFFLISLLFFPTKHFNGLFWGAIGGIIVDVYLIGFKKGKGALAEWHTKRQLHKTNNYYILIDTLLFLLGLFLIWWFK